MNAIGFKHIYGPVPSRRLVSPNLNEVSEGGDRHCILPLLCFKRRFCIAG